MLSIFSLEKMNKKISLKKMSKTGNLDANTILRQSELHSKSLFKEA